MSADAATSGQLGVRKFRVDHTGTPTVLTLGAVADGQYLRRNGTALEGAAAGGGSSQLTFDAVIPDDYTLLSTAIAGGATSVFVRDGTYQESASVTFPSWFRAVGESHNTIIELTSSATALQTASDAAYSTGLVTLTNGSATVTGASTSWLGDVAAGDTLVVGVGIFTVAAVASDTSLTITTAYTGDTATGLSYYTYTPSTVTLERMTFLRSASTNGGLLNLQQCNGFKVEYCQFIRPGAANNTGGSAIAVDYGSFGTIGQCMFQYDDVAVSVNNSVAVNITECHFQGGSTAAVSLAVTDGMSISNCAFKGNEVGILLGTGATDHLSLSDIVIQHPNTYGIEITEDASADSIKLNNVYVESAGGSGFGVAGTLVYSQFNGMTITGSTDNGILFNGTTAIRDLMISNSHLSDNGGAGTVLGPAVIASINFSGCYFNNNGTNGIIVRGDDVSFTGCQANDNVNAGIRVDSSATDCVITGGRFTGNDTGIWLRAGATRAQVTGVNTLGNTTDNLLDDSTGATKTGNQS